MFLCFIPFGLVCKTLFICVWKRRDGCLVGFKVYCDEVRTRVGEKVSGFKLGDSLGGD